MSKKICAITTIDATQRDFVIPAMRLLRDNGWDVTILCNMSDEFIRDYNSEFRLINIPFYRGISIKDLLLMPLRLRKFFKQENFDLIQYSTPNASLYASIAGRIAGVPHRLYCQWGIRYVGCKGIMRSILKMLEKITCQNSTHIRPASYKNMEFAISEGLYDRGIADVIGDGGTVGIDLEQFNPKNSSVNRSLILNEYPQLKDKLIYAFVGRLNVDKGIFELIEAFHKLECTHANVALILIGNFDGKLPGHLKDNLESSNIIMTGWTDNVPKYLSAADILVHPSYREGFSMVIQQAMALQKPIVTTDIPGPSEVIESGKSGLIVPPRDSQSLFKAMEWMLTHPEERKSMGISALNRCKRLFARERMLNLTLEDREKILSSL